MNRKRTPIHRYQDKYNPDKVWLVRYYPRSTVTYNQEICGRKVNKAYKRVKLTWLRSILQDVTK